MCCANSPITSIALSALTLLDFLLLFIDRHSLPVSNSTISSSLSPDFLSSILCHRGKLWFTRIGRLRLIACYAHTHQLASAKRHDPAR